MFVSLSLLALLAASPALAQEEAPGETPGGEELPIIEGPSILEYVEAAYPEEAEAAGLEGLVKVIIELDEQGELQNIEVSEPAGHGFDEAAVDAILQMKFAPAQTEAGPVPVVFEFEYGFTLQPEEPEVEEAPPPVNLEGRIREMGTRKYLEGITVIVDGTDLTAVTDAEGNFAIRGAPLGNVVVRLLSPDHVPLEKEVEIVDGEATVLALWIRSEAYRENEVVGVYERKQEEVTRRTITIEEVRRVPGTFGDPLKVIQTLPGAARTPFGTGLLVIRGSNPEDSGVYIDGIRIPIIYHLTGTTSVISPDLIESVDYLPGGYGVQYGRSMGGVVDVKTKEVLGSDDGQGRLVWGTDILDSQIYYEGRLGKNKKQTVAVAGRRSYIDAFIPIFTRDSGFTLKPRYVDYQAKWAPILDGGKKASVFFYGFDDVLEIATPEDQAQGADQDTQGDLRTQYASQRLIANYETPIGEGVRLQVTPSLGVDYGFFGLGDEFTLDNFNYLAQVRAQMPWELNEHVEVIPGVDLFAGAWRFDFRTAIRVSDLDDPLAEREPIGFDGNGELWSPDAFLKVNLRPFDDPDKLLITPGIRLNVVGLTTKGSVTFDEDVPALNIISADPRILARWEFVDNNVIKAATGIYHQPPQPQEAVGIAGSAVVGYEQVHQTSLGYEQQLTQSIKWDIDLFYKDFSNLLVFDEAWDGSGSAFINAGDGRAYGAELIARHEPTGRFFGWVSYTLSRSERRDSADGDWYPFDFDQTHIFSAQAGYDLPRDFGVSAQVQYVTGNPDTPYNAGIYDIDGEFYNPFRIGGYNNERLPPFFQTSLRFDKLWTFKRWQLESYVDLLNAVRGVNPEFTVYNYDYTEAAYVRGLPFIPNIGLEAKFWL